MLVLDMSPFMDAPAPPAQRVTVVLNGEISREVVLTARRLIRCRVPRRTIEAADRLAITLLHPDAAALASASNPLDDRALSVVLHSLTLTPASVHTRTDSVGAEVLPPDPVRPTREQFERDFVNTKVPDDQIEIARQNNDVVKRRILARGLPSDAKEAANYYLKQNATKYSYTGQAPPQTIFNPPAWADFIQAWKRGDFRNNN